MGRARMTAWRILAVECGGPQPTPLLEMARPLLLVFPADADGEALAAAMAQEHGAAVLGRIVSVSRDGEELTVTRSTHGGRITLDLQVTEGLAVATANVMPECDGEIALGAPSAVPADRIALGDRGVALESARIVIGGGRGLDAGGFAELERIAAALGGAVAASLPAVDLGLAPVSRQVGQSGKFVTPELYLAAGMSGTPQHLAGIGTATRIIAINSDPDAPIFAVAEAGAVADARALLPLLGAAIEALPEAVA
jgi:electron transfer flavoprotein alpha subunit